ncbi:PilZ domain-containing protein [Natronospirillum operosum]|uniref:PilZ domain-containing protein n=1 Tax=Natronospirillum operosum TaxID=2759953 RepID=A0A4Z0WKI2_9GAMM|nr:PilZ domain-containing protein [Natronospirillum operosum]TGG95951.1 PilZ domain-containing protein [Natronospirillum operosum]
MIDRDYSEKRGYMRMNMDAPATLKLADGTQKHCTCKDLSAIGMLLETDTAIPLDDTLEVHVPAFSNQFSPLDAEVRVTRVDEPEPGLYHLGVEILQMK